MWVWIVMGSCQTLQNFTDLTKYGSHVYVLVRRGELRASKIMAKRLLSNSKIVRFYSCFQSTFADTTKDCLVEHCRR